MKIKSAIAAILFTCLPAVAGERMPVAEFTPGESEKLDCRIVDDGVMGGLSKGKREISEDGILRFFGTLSLENNGGFSSLRTGPVKLDLSSAEGLMLRIKGDGRTYQVRLSTDAEYRGSEMSFQAGFPTEKGKWTEVKVPFDRLLGTWRGMDLPDKTFDPAKIRRLGLIVADKKEGPFELRVDWIRTYGGNDSPPDLVAAAVADGRFGTLAKALGAAGLVKTLQGEGPFTVFAPTDKAFAKLPEGTLDDLLKTANRAKLESILKYQG
jgi:monofunctional biosynthetic peptidoglycan transglycosylase